MSPARVRRTLLITVAASAGLLVVAAAVLLLRPGAVHSDGWQQGYTAGVSAGAQIRQELPADNAGAGKGAVLGCEMASYGLGAEPGPDGASYPPLPGDIKRDAAMTKEYREGWAKGCEDALGRR